MIDLINKSIRILIENTLKWEARDFGEDCHDLFLSIISEEIWGHIIKEYEILDWKVIII